MGYTMKSNIPELLGINPELSTYDIPVFEKDLDDSHWGAALNNMTIHINKDLSEKNKKHAVEHEMEHIKQFRNGTVRYDNKNIYYKPTPGSPMHTIARSSIKEGDPSLPWEKVIYDKTKVYPTKIK